MVFSGIMGLPMVSGHAAARQPGPMNTLSKNLDAVMADKGGA